MRGVAMCWASSAATFRLCPSASSSILSRGSILGEQNTRNWDTLCPGTATVIHSLAELHNLVCIIWELNLCVHVYENHPLQFEIILEVCVWCCVISDYYYSVIVYHPLPLSIIIVCHCVCVKLMQVVIRLIINSLLSKFTHWLCVLTSYIGSAMNIH